MFKFYKILQWEKPNEKPSERVDIMEQIVNKMILDNNIKEENVVSIDIQFDKQNKEYYGKIIVRINNE